ncbi:MAG: UDP-galactopyranose mutase [Chitinophagaceae bacterium]|nr:UDP-galactopyranose mutase [Chitinophagaceae bacterium]
MDWQNLKYLVVGSGFFGATMAERIASQLNEKVLLIDKRPHIGGNCHSQTDEETSIEYHTYGTHIFHTSNELVWNYINQFTSFNGYRHQVLTTYENKVYQLPINLETINSFYNLSLKPFEVEQFLKEQIGNDYIEHPSNFEEKAINLIGKKLYEAFIKGYSKKQWGCSPAQLPVDILNRLPFRKSYNESYYNSKWQGIPEFGYTAIFEKMLSHPNIEIRLNTDFFSLRSHLYPDTKIIYSGPIDSYFDYCYGKLEWRTLEFEKEIIEVEDYQGTSVMNYADEEIPFTRIHEPRHLHTERNYPDNKTLIIREYSKADDGKNPYYPLHNIKNRELVLKYRALADSQPNLIIAGRLGDYRYYDMHDTIHRALSLFNERMMK